jgi:hypothetical protein
MHTWGWHCGSSGTTFMGDNCNWVHGKSIVSFTRFLKYQYFFFLTLFFFGSTRVWTQAFVLARWALLQPKILVFFFFFLFLFAVLGSIPGTRQALATHWAYLLCLFVFFFWQHWRLSSWFHASRQQLYHLKHSTSPKPLFLLVLKLSQFWPVGSFLNWQLW